jgi:hypothetical protein
LLAVDPLLLMNVTCQPVGGVLVEPPVGPMYVMFGDWPV